MNDGMFIDKYDENLKTDKRVLGLFADGALNPVHNNREVSTTQMAKKAIELLEKNENYWHGVVRSLIFRFPDDLEILRVDSRNLIQVRSASRIGLSDLGVNQKRVDNLYMQLMEEM